jgi:hypothetical protein
MTLPGKQSKKMASNATMCYLLAILSLIDCPIGKVVNLRVLAIVVLETDECNDAIEV